MLLLRVGGLQGREERHELCPLEAPAWPRHKAGHQGITGSCPCSLGSLYGPTVGEAAQISGQGIIGCKSGNLINVLTPSTVIG